MLVPTAELRENIQLELLSGKHNQTISLQLPSQRAKAAGNSAAAVAKHEVVEEPESEHRRPPAGILADGFQAQKGGSRRAQKAGVSYSALNVETDGEWSDGFEDAGACGEGLRPLAAPRLPLAAAFGAGETAAAVHGNLSSLEGLLSSGQPFLQLIGAAALQQRLQDRWLRLCIHRGDQGATA